ncbi:Hypothetical predicted protein [Mytilus galloprovincialis]|uniref:Death domain-containing protein n=1 Tax=Mytilus galloprovincialis TaxID=29158 RepID=A0A8B6CLG7_MYTGA|nr:Hypothetical predicted protein [Mytilus galloprovincialis]
MLKGHSLINIAVAYNKNDLLQLLSGDLATSFDSRILVVGAYEAVRTEDVIQQKGELPGKTQPDIPNDDILQKLSKKIDEFEDDSFTDHASDQEVIPIPVLDFAGQIVNHATHQTFITSHGIYLVTFDGSKNLNDALGDREDERRITILVILNAVLSMLLNDAQLLRISNSLTLDEVGKMAFDLGVSNTEIDAIGSDFIPMNKFYSLRIFREKNKSCRDFVKAMDAVKINSHTMCQILRQEEVTTDLPDKIRNLPPSDEMLDKLCLRIGKEWMVLGLELGIEIERLEQIEYDKPKVIREISRQMLYCWRNRDDESTIRELLQALERSGRNPHLVTEILENCESYRKLILVD